MFGQFHFLFLLQLSGKLRWLCGGGGLDCVCRGKDGKGKHVIVYGSHVVFVLLPTSVVL